MNSDIGLQPSEQEFVRQMKKRLELVKLKRQSDLTDFLNPREQYLVKSLAATIGVPVTFSIGFEKKRALLGTTHPNGDYQVSLVAIKTSEPSKLKHSGILGTLILKHGLNRQKIGDILNQDDVWQFTIDATLADYLETQVNYIGGQPVELKQTKLTDLIDPTSDLNEKFILISSLRLDNFIATGYNISRSTAKELIEDGQVSLNWVTMIRPERLVAVDDVISVRRFGRIYVQTIDGLSKKNKIKVTVGVINR